MNDDGPVAPSFTLFATPADRRDFRARLFRPRVILLLVTIFLIAVAPVAHRGWRISQVPDIELPYDPQPILDLVVRDEDNAWVEFRQAVTLVVPMDKALQDDLTRAWKEDWAPIPPSLLEWSTTNRAALEVWKRGVKKPDALYMQAKDFDPYRVQPGLFTEMRLIHRAAEIETMRLLDEDRFDEAWDLCRMQFRAANLIRRHGEYYQGLGGVGLSNLPRRCAARWIQSERLSIEHLQQALDELRNDLRPEAWLADAIRFHGIKLHLLDAAVQASPKAWVNPYVRGPIRATLFLTGEPVVGRRVQKLEIANFVQCCELPLRSRPKFTKWPHIFDVGVDTGTRRITAVELGEWTQSSIIEASSHVRGATNALDLSDREKLAHELLITAVVVEIFKRKHGDYPESLSQLVPEFLPCVPDNTFAAIPTPIDYLRGSPDMESRVELRAPNPKGAMFDLVVPLGKKSRQRD